MIFISVERGLDRIRLLHVVGKDQACDGALGPGDADRAVHNHRKLRRRHYRMDVLVRHILEQRLEIHLLLLTPAQRGARLLPDDRYGPMIATAGWWSSFAS